ncbi:hypothetical protein [Leptolyngbya sp. NIES-2104]|nr:hypothetical protein [Leptolyngbya sp. NIES-2104]GAP94756.1 hypothetical protein NIES2104_12730 [Leptolyngbya sp. NIES-2104]
MLFLLIKLQDIDFVDAFPILGFETKPFGDIDRRSTVIDLMLVATR